MVSCFLRLLAERDGAGHQAGWVDIHDVDLALPNSYTRGAFRVISVFAIPVDADQPQEDFNHHSMSLSCAAGETLRSAQRLSGNVPLVIPAFNFCLQPINENAFIYLYNREGCGGVI
jgi:hypothetical protein